MGHGIVSHLALSLVFSSLGGVCSTVLVDNTCIQNARTRVRAHTQSRTNHRFVLVYSLRNHKYHPPKSKVKCVKITYEQSHKDKEFSTTIQEIVQNFNMKCFEI